MITGTTPKLAAARPTKPVAHQTVKAYTYKGKIKITAINDTTRFDGRGYEYDPDNKVTQFQLDNGACGQYYGEDFANVGDTYEVTVRFNEGYKGQAFRDANRIWIK